jgi:hypothetical protein
MARIFLGNFKVKQKPKWNSLYQMKPVDTKIDHFGC